MPTYRLTIEKYWSFASEYWTNVYHVNAADPAAAVPLMDAIVAAEASIHWNTVNITKGRIDDMQPDTDVFFTKVYNTPGSFNAATEPLPLFVVTRIDFGSTAGNRPSRKYYRGTLTEGEVTHNSLLAGLQTRMTGFITSIIGTGYCDEKGNDINSGALWPQPAMRQLRRGSKKKVTQSPGGTPV
jgi:hypothetical protein